VTDQARLMNPSVAAGFCAWLEVRGDNWESKLCMYLSHRDEIGVVGVLSTRERVHKWNPSNVGLPGPAGWPERPETTSPELAGADSHAPPGDRVSQQAGRSGENRAGRQTQLERMSQCAPRGQMLEAAKKMRRIRACGQHR
jgi:hypothetical protein